MLTLFGGREQRFCDGLTRRSFLRIGALGMGGISLGRPLRAEAALGRPAGDRSVIMVYLPGGPTQHETFDPKPAAPVEIRGSFDAINTSVPGVHFSGLLPELSRRAEMFSVVRTLTGMEGRHESFQCYTGRPGGRPGDPEPGGGWPTFGSVASRLLGPGGDGTAAYVDAGPKMAYSPYNNRGTHDASGRVSWPGFTGPAHVPFTLEGDVGSDLVLKGIDPVRLDDRRRLLERLQQFRRQVDAEGVDDHQRRAFELLTSSRIADAIDLEREDASVRERYGQSQPTDGSFGGAPQSPQHLLLARRLVEVGVRCVTVAFGAWDWHGNREGPIDRLAKKYLPVFDHALAVFLDDLSERGLLERVTVVVWGEFGRTPRINKVGGRDHWPSTQSVLLAGGGIEGGRVIGQTDRTGGMPIERPVHVQEVLATLYRNLGIDVGTATVADLNGRPHYLVDAGRQPVGELY